MMAIRSAIARIAATAAGMKGVGGAACPLTVVGDSDFASNFGLGIQGNKITSVSRKGQATYPANARVINATGKFVLPGLWDSQVAYSWYFGEAMLNHGITSSIDVGTEAGVRTAWDRFIGVDGTFIGMTGFGASGPAELLYKHFGITAEAVVKAAG